MKSHGPKFQDLARMSIRDMRSAAFYDHSTDLSAARLIAAQALARMRRHPWLVYIVLTVGRDFVPCAPGASLREARKAWHT